MITAAQYAGTYQQVGDSSFRVLVQLTDDVAGVYTKWFTATGSTAVALRDDISRQIAALNDSKTEKVVLDGIANGTNIPVTAPTPPALTAEQIWFRDLAKLQRLNDAVAAGAMPASDANYVAFKADVLARFLTVYVADF